MHRKEKPSRLAWNTRTLSAPAPAAVDSSAPWRMEMLGCESTSLTRDSTNPVAAAASATPPRPTPRKEPPRLPERARWRCFVVSPPPQTPFASLWGATTRDGPQCGPPPLPSLSRPPRGCFGRLYRSLLGSCAHWRRASDRVSARFVNVHARSYLIAN